MQGANVGRSVDAKGSHIYVFLIHQHQLQRRENAAQFRNQVRVDHPLIIHAEPSHAPSRVKGIPLHVDTTISAEYLHATSKAVRARRVLVATKFNKLVYRHLLRAIDYR
jgi:hypothetical protein